jgi:thioredoxin reductase (NADPH)
VILASGASYRRIDSANLRRLEGAGVYFTVPHDTRMFQGQDVAVCGAGNSGGQAIVHLAKNARRVNVYSRHPLERTMSDYLVRHIDELCKENVTINEGCEVVDGHGDASLQDIVIRNVVTGQTQTVPTGLLFVMIGVDPHTAWLADTLERDPRGYICSGTDVTTRSGWPADRHPDRHETSIPGVFACGDVRLGSVKRLSAAVGEGSAAVQAVLGYLASPVNIEAATVSQSVA